MLNHELAKNTLLEGKYSCVLVKEGKVIVTSFDKGVKPIIKILLEEKDKMEGAVLADKVIGKAAALLAVYGKVQGVYSKIVGDCAKTVLEKNGLFIQYDRAVPYIMNLHGDDRCPMEKLVEDIQDPEEAFQAIKNIICGKIK